MTAQPVTRQSIQNGDFVRQVIDNTTLAPTQRGGTSARFFKREIENPVRTKQAGAKMYDTQIEVEIRVAGDNSMGPTRRITDITGAICGQEYIDMFPAQWAAFQRGEEVVVDGTPIETWPMIDRAMALSLKSLHIHRVEDLATVSDGLLDKLGIGARSLRSKAQAYLESAKGSADAMRLAEERDTALAEKAEIQARFAAMEAKLANLTLGGPAVPAAVPNTDPLAPVAAPGATAVSDADLDTMLAAAASGPMRRGPGRPPNPR